MKERPILFTGEMVKAILEGRKTQSRRPIKLKEFRICDNVRGSDWYFRTGQLGIWSDVSTQFLIKKYCPKGVSGDRLWVRETCAIEYRNLESIEDWYSGDCPVPTDRPVFHHKADENNEFDEEYWLVPHYRATDPVPELEYVHEEEPTCKWRPSIYMPRWASRITLEVTNIKIERVQDITYIDLEKEGMNGDVNSAFSKWKTLWNKIYTGDRSWESNPWVWVIEFRKVESSWENQK